VGFAMSETGKSEAVEPGLVRVPAGAARAFSPEAGLQRRILANNPQMMLVEHRMEATWVGTRHAHPQDQLVYVIAGRLQFIAGSRSFEVGAGDSFIIAGGVEHEARALAESVVLDVFTPPRLDYL
jgi:quercetin dioxygenase-like cupin family protein